LEEKVNFELDAGNNGWRCSGCGLLIDAIGRPLLGNETWVIQSKGIAWIENKPEWNYCPKCGKAVDKHA